MDFQNQSGSKNLDNDRIVVEWATGRKFFVMKEAKIDTRRRILRVGEKRMPFGWFIPFNEKESFNLLGKQMEAYQSKPLYLADVFPPSFLTVLFTLLRRLEDLFPPELWTVLWELKQPLH